MSSRPSPGKKDSGSEREGQNEPDLVELHLDVGRKRIECGCGKMSGERREEFS